VPDNRISLRDRVRALDRANQLAFELNAMASWLADNGVETESDMWEKAAKDILAGCWLLERPIRAAMPPEAWR
jgi:hypothetical protein